ncbi:hypothetical protein [Salinicoccus sp. HZC-1]|uniref:hypothetical protein n=1 Tax=Salinicoccus sp. HZC-1 TaxID=3385497 RepID=UPI00398AF833
MQPYSTYVEADSEYHAVKRGWMVIESNDENLKKLNISCAAVKEVNEARSVSVFMLDGNETKTSVSE